MRALGLRGGVMLLELGELLRLLAATAELDPRVDGDLAGVLWEASLPHLLVEAEDDPLGLLEGDASARELEAERARDVAELQATDAAAIEQRHHGATGVGAGRGAPFAPSHEALMEILMRLPADARRRAEAEAIFGVGGDHLAVPRAQALHVDEETRLAMLADLDADPVAAVERSAVPAARAWLSGGSPTFGGALRASIDRLAAVEPAAALAFVHVACESLEGPAAVRSGEELEFDLALGPTGAAAPLAAGPEPEVRRALAHTWVTPAALGPHAVRRRARRGRRPPHGPVAGRRHGGADPRSPPPPGRELRARRPRRLPRVRGAPVRDELGQFLVRVGPGMVGPIAALLPSAGVDAAIALIRLLVTMGTRLALDAVGAAGKSPYALVRIEALGALEGAASERLRVELKTLLEDPEPAVRVAALRLIADNRIMAAGPHLALHAKDEAFDELPLVERRAVLGTLAVLLPSRAEAICMEHAERAALLPRASREETRELAAEILGDIASSPEMEAALLAVAGRKWRNTERIRAVALGGRAAHRPPPRSRSRAPRRAAPIPAGGGPR